MENKTNNAGGPPSLPVEDQKAKALKEAEWEKFMAQPIGKPTTLKKLLFTMEDSISRGLPSYIPFGRVVNVAISAVTGTPALRQCSKLSFIKALVESLSIGLEPCTALNHAYLVPYAGEVKLIPGYQGLIELAYRSDRVGSVDADCIFEGEDFAITKGNNPTFEHTPNYSVERTWDKLLYVYALVRIKGAELFPIVEVMTKAEIEKTRATSKAKKAGTPWDQWPLEMAKKTALKRVLKKTPKSPELDIPLAHAIQLDNQALSGEKQIFSTDFGEHLDQDSENNNDKPEENIEKG